jgi:hypothetical protein
VSDECQVGAMSRAERRRNGQAAELNDEAVEWAGALRSPAHSQLIVSRTRRSRGSASEPWHEPDEPGVSLTGTVLGQRLHETLKWKERSADLAPMEDFNRSTEEGAEALGLALAGRRCGWRVKRRLQSRLSEGVDWLMVRGTRHVVVEVGGTDEGDLEVLYKRKVSQAQAASWPKGTARAACVVRFVEPKVLFWSSDGTR